MGKEVLYRREGRLTQEDFLSRCKVKWGNRYDYKKSKYISSRDKITITCRVHGDFITTPNSHLSTKNVGCPRCMAIKKSRMNRDLARKRRPESISQPKNYKLIPLTRGKFAKVDNDDFEKVRYINWHTTHYGYANNRRYLMHNFILDTPDGFVVDHINGDKLDNRRKNLRVVTDQQNSFNQSKRQGTSSKYIGVYWDKSRNKWASEIKYNYKKIHIGRFDCEIEAARVRDEKAKELFGEYAKLNFK